MSAAKDAAGRVAGHAAGHAAGARPGSPDRLHTVQVGMGWHLEDAGGLNRYFRDLLAHLADAGVDADGLVAGSPDVESRSSGLMRSFASPTAPFPRRLLAARRAVGRAVAPESLLVSHFAPYGLALLGAARTHPLVSWFHGPWADEAGVEGRGRASVIVRRLLEGRVYARSAACVVLSRAFGDLLARRYHVPRARIHVIPGGVDAPRFDGLPSRAEARRRLGWPEHAPTVVAVRRLVKRTGVDRLVRAVPALRARVSDVQVMVVGEGPERRALEDEATALGVGGTVRFTGFIDEATLPLAYRAADITVVPTVALEGFGLIVPESLAAGTPALVTPVGGLPETVEALDPMLVLRDSTPEAIAGGLVNALGGMQPPPDAARCARFARERYDWPVVAARAEALLRRVRAEWRP